MSKEDFADYLQRSEKLRESDLSRIKRMQEETPDVSFVSMLNRLGAVSDKDIAQALADMLELPIVEREDYPTEAVLNGSISFRFLKENSSIPLNQLEDKVVLAMADPLDQNVIDAVRIATGKSIEVRIGTLSDIDEAINQISGLDSSKMDQIVDEVNVDEISDDELDHLKDLASEAPVIRLVNLIIQRAAEQGASDIHIEPFEGNLKVRYRIDGVLQEVESPPRQFAAAIISRIKIMAKLNIAERRLPQDGRIRSRIQGREYDMRISTVPTMHGESVVMRLLNQESVVLDFKALGFQQHDHDKFIQALRQPHGMILLTGPTGSGKTTTLYTALSLLNEPHRKIITVEDPVEYQLEGINQIQAKASIGLTFANALRSIVRQDPDVIMVGEMRDLETAEICVQSALTGHLVLSTLHTNDSVSSITRLMEMGVEDYLLTSTLNVVIAQRLVRVLCEECKTKTELPSNLKEEMRTIQAGGHMYVSEGGCEACHYTGYKGRITIIEMLIITDEIRKLILEHADAVTLAAAASQQGMRTMYQDGLQKVAQGLTTLEEILRVTQDA
ncbi:MAG: type II secretion system ATPase GspE [Gammaproteobacteria bacterium]